MQNSGRRRTSLEIFGLIGLACVAFFVFVFGGEKIVLLLNGLCFGTIITYIAYRYPAVTVALWGLSTQLMVEMIIWDYSNYVEPSLSAGGGVDMLYGDPLLFGFLTAMIIKLISGDNRARFAFFRDNFFWTVFFIWLVFEVVRSMAMFGMVSPLGEFRTYFREILIVPYIGIFARTREQQWRMFTTIIVLSLLFIPIGLFRGAYVHNFAFAAYAKWLYQHGSLALVWGALSVFLIHRYGLWKYNSIWFAGIMVISVALTVIASHRSVWLAAIVSFFVLFLLGHIRFGNLVKMGVGMAVAAITIDFLYADVNLLDFVKERFTALTAPDQDETASWRYMLWLDALEQSKAHLLEGKGLGNYFSFRSTTGAVITTMLHNQYVQLIYQVGVIGLILYILFVVHTLRRLRRTYLETMDLSYQLIALVSMTVMIGASAYYVAYDFEPFTWMYIGIGMAVAQSHRDEKLAQYEVAYSYYPMSGG